MTSAIQENSQSTTEISSAFTKAWNAHDLEEIVGMFHPNATFKTPASDTALSGAALRSYFESMLGAMPDMTFENVGEVATIGNMFAGQVVVNGTWTRPFSVGPLAGMNPTGKSARFMAANFLKVHDGKITNCTQYYDRMTLLTQLGVIPSK
jgi:steroid delta-isomerase-like uncharacterized protein